MCPQARTTSGFFASHTIDVAGVTRRYDLSLPKADPSKPLPLVFVFHADTGTSIRSSVNLEKTIGDDAIIVYPYGFGAWDLSAPDTNGDYTFIEALRASLEQSSCVDRDRVFAFGFSNGGFFANMLACYRGPSLFRAIAVSSGGLYPPEGAGGYYDENGNFICPMKPVAALVIHGKSDTVVDYQDNGIGSRDAWLTMNGCGARSNAFAPSPCVTYDGCENPVGFCAVNLGHSLWSHAGEAAWAFFSEL